MRTAAALIAGALLALAGCGDGAQPAAAPAQPAAQPRAAQSQADAANAGEEVAPQVTPVYAYDPTGKRDPFRSFHWDRIRMERDKLAERGPLEQYDLSQLSVVAIVWAHDTARALVQDPAGRAYIVSEGTRMGKNDGKVIRIDDTLVLVKETYYNFLAEESTRDVELRIRTSQGG